MLLYLGKHAHNNTAQAKEGWKISKHQKALFHTSQEINYKK